MKFNPSTNIYTVSRLNSEVKQLLEGHFLQVWLEGEISNLVKAGSGHWYFKLKDERAQVQCAMFKGSNRHVRFNVQNGEQVLIKAKISLYEPRGDYQLIAESMESAGEGKLKQAFEQLKFQLASQGYFAQEQKKPLPEHIKTIGLITSASGAAVEDMITVLGRRAPQLKIIIYPCLVQGELAANQIASQVYLANQRDEVDVLIVGRGGGSLEDLWAFNEEIVAHAIFQSRLPIISAVGHEIDVTISDFVADIRAATPSAAAEIVSQQAMDNSHIVNQYKDKLALALQASIQHFKAQINSYELRLSKQDPKRDLQFKQQKVDEINFRLNAAIKAILTQQNQRLNKAEHSLKKHSPREQVKKISHKHELLTRRLNQAITQLVQDKQHQLSLKAEKLNAYSPLATLGRGYSLTFDDKQQVVRSSKTVETGQKLDVLLQDGKLACQVIGKS
ncbi:exodeoxyribonuclease VII large subunit [Catenovulum sp. SM1970]|uniref:exodeoxyribonuclease VII large subunit n=1 Tax=Marinifaba aquimaris TaxID=2741323 RepID=UPI001572E718|nr:exodeoxyribonuclease VII large subunit [Marinifaba aquimaris]NTS77685.1 exodeoxyribonuclease VII large subunit [Marinifaba aquimaris]